MTLNQYEYESLDNYFSLLKEEGYASSLDEDKLIVLDMINELLNGDFKSCLSSETVNDIIVPILHKIINSSCIFKNINCKC